jgi:hypothetical protein
VIVCVPPTQPPRGHTDDATFPHLFFVSRVGRSEGVTTLIQSRAIQSGS